MVNSCKVLGVRILCSCSFPFKMGYDVCLKFFKERQMLFSVLKYSKPKSFELCFINYFICIFRTSSLEGSISSNLKNLSEEAKGEIKLHQNLTRSQKGFVCARQESVSPVLFKFWMLYGRVNGDLLQRAYAIQVCCITRPTAPEVITLTCTSAGDTQTQFSSLCGFSH